MARTELSASEVNTIFNPIYGVQAIKLDEAILDGDNPVGRYKVAFSERAACFDQSDVRITQYFPNRASAVVIRNKVAQGHFVNGPLVTPGYQLVHAGKLHMGNLLGVNSDGTSQLLKVEDFRVSHPVSPGQKLDIQTVEQSVSYDKASGKVKFLVGGIEVASAREIVVERAGGQGSLKAASSLPLEIAAQTALLTFLHGDAGKYKDFLPVFVGFRLFEVFVPIHIGEQVEVKVNIRNRRENLLYFDADVYSNNKLASRITRFVGGVVPREEFMKAALLPTASTTSAETSS